MRHTPFVILDIETTGGSPRHSRVLEVGAVRIENMEIVQTFSRLVNPERSVPDFITKLTGIDDQMVTDAPLFRGIAQDLELFAREAVFVAHNVHFDYSFIKAEMSECGIYFNADRLCSVQLSRKLYPEHRRHGLDYVIERLGIEVGNRHRAYDDAFAVWKFIESEYRLDPARLFLAIDKLIIPTRGKARSISRVTQQSLDLQVEYGSAEG